MIMMKRRMKKRKKEKKRKKRKMLLWRRMHTRMIGQVLRKNNKIKVCKKHKFDLLSLHM